MKKLAVDLVSSGKVLLANWSILGWTRWTLCVHTWQCLKMMGPQNYSVKQLGKPELCQVFILYILLFSPKTKDLVGSALMKTFLTRSSTEFPSPPDFQIHWFARGALFDYPIDGRCWQSQWWWEKVREADKGMRPSTKVLVLRTRMLHHATHCCWALQKISLFRLSVSIRWSWSYKKIQD